MAQSLTLDEESGRKCYMIGGRGFKIEWQEVPENWSRPSLTNSRFIFWKLDTISLKNGKFEADFNFCY